MMLSKIAGMVSIGFMLSLSGCALQCCEPKQPVIVQPVEPKAPVTSCPDGFCPIADLSHHQTQTSRYGTAISGMNDAQSSPLFSVSDFRFSQQTQSIEEAVQQVLLATGYSLLPSTDHSVQTLLSKPLASNQYSLKGMSAIQAMQTLLGNYISISANPLTRQIKLAVSSEFLKMSDATQQQTEVSKSLANDQHDQGHHTHQSAAPSETAAMTDIQDIEGISHA